MGHQPGDFPYASKLRPIVPTAKPPSCSKTRKYFYAFSLINVESKAAVTYGSGVISCDGGAEKSLEYIRGTIIERAMDRYLSVGGVLAGVSRDMLSGHIDAFNNVE